MKFKFSVIVCSYKRSATLIQSLRDLEAQSRNDFEVILVEQLPGEMESSLQGEEFDFEMNHIEIRDWANLPRARNVGLAEAQGEIVVFIDDDVRMHSDFLEKYAQSYKLNSEASAIAGPFFFPELGHQEPKRRFRVKNCSLDELTDVEFIARKGWTRANQVWHPSLKEPTWVIRGRGCNMTFRLQALREFNLAFCPSFRGRAGGEESDLFLRLWQAGGKVWYDPECYLNHLGEEVGGCRAQGRSSVPLLIDAAYNNILMLIGTRSRFGMLFQILSGERLWVPESGKLKFAGKYLRRLFFYSCAFLKFPFWGGRGDETPWQGMESEKP